jgi:hypothetical protein
LALYRHALQQKDYLKLSKFELYSIQTSVFVMSSMAGICLFALILPVFLPDNMVALSGFAYSLLWPVIHLIHKNRENKWQLMTQ